MISRTISHYHVIGKLGGVGHGCVHNLGALFTPCISTHFAASSKKYGPFPLVSSRYKIGVDFGIVETQKMASKQVRPQAPQTNLIFDLAVRSYLLLFGIKDASADTEISALAVQELGSPIQEGWLVGVGWIGLEDLLGKNDDIVHHMPVTARTAYSENAFMGTLWT